MTVTENAVQDYYTSQTNKLLQGLNKSCPSTSDMLGEQGRAGPVLAVLQPGPQGDAARKVDR